MLKFNSFRAQRYLRSRFIEGKYLLASEASDIELELIDFSRKLIQSTMGDIAVEGSWKAQIYYVTTKVTGKVGNVLSLDTSLLDLLHIGDKVFKSGALNTDITNVSVGGGTITVTSAAGISIGDTIQVQTTTTILLSAGEAWFEGLPFLMRGGEDQLVSGSTLAPGVLVVPGGGASSITMQDEPLGLGKLVTFSDGGTTPTDAYQVVISAREQVITNTDDPFIKNVNIPESTAQKLRLTYRINVVPQSAQTSQPIPYTDSSVDGNLTNYIDVIPQTGANGSEISRTVVSGSQAIDGRNLEITIRNNAAGSNPLYPGSPTGNPIPTGSSQQQDFSNGRFVDSLGQEFWLNAIFNDVVANQVIIRLDKEVSQTDPQIIIGKPYRLIKRDVYVTDDNGGSPLGQLFWPVANIDWDATDGFVHDSKVQDLRNSVESITETEEKTTVKFNLRLLGGGIVVAEPSVKASGTIIVNNNTFDASDAVIINGLSFVYNIDWIAGVDAAATAANIVAAISASHNPLVDGVVLASALSNVITITAVVGGTAGNSLTLGEVDGGTNNFTLSGPNLTGGVDGTPGELVWSDDFKIANPHGVVQQILAGSAVLREGGAIAYIMDLVNGGVISKGSLAVTTTSTGTSISLSGSPDLSKVKVGNTLLVGQTSTSITEIDDVNKVLNVFPSLGVMGSGAIYLDTYAEGTLPTDPDSFILAVKVNDIIQVTGRGELQPGESTSSGTPIQLLQYIGATSETDSDPNYSSTRVINQGDNLTVAIGKLDNQAGKQADYTGAPLNDSTPDYSSNYAITDGQDLTTAIGELDAAQADSDTYTGKPSATDTTPDYSSNHYVADNDNLTTAVSKLDAALFATDSTASSLDAEVTALETYVGAPANDTTPDYSSNYVISDGDDLTVAAGKLDAAAAATDTYTGKPTALDTTPDYSTNHYITDGQDLTTAIGELDVALFTTDGNVTANAAAIAAETARELQDRNAKLTKGGTWNWNQTTGVLTWSANAFVQIPDLADTVNQLDAANVTLSADGQVAKVELNRTGSGGSLTVTTAAIASVTATNNTFLFARRVGNDVLIGETFLLKDREYLELEGAMAEISRRLNQLRLQTHLTNASKALISAADITQLDGAVLSQELSNFILNFSGAVINFQTGAVLASDDSTALGINFTPFTIPASQYFWYGIGMVAAAVGGDNRIGAQVQVTQGSAANAAQASAPLPVLSGDKHLGAVQVFNNAGTIQVVAIRRLGVGSGSGGSGTGDTTRILESLKNEFVDSPYELLTPNITATDAAAKWSSFSGATYDLVNKVINFSANAQVATSVQMADTIEFLSRALDIGSIDLSVFWNKGTSLQAFAVPTGFTYEVSRDGGTNWFAVTMAQVGSTEVFRGNLRFDTTTTTEATKQTIVTQATQDANRVLNATTQQAVSQAFTLAATTKLQEVVLQIAKAGSPTGTLVVSIVKDSSGSPSLLSTDIYSQSNPVSVSSIAAGPGALTVDIADVVLVAGTYHVVMTTDAAYKTSFVSTTAELRLREKQTSPAAPFVNVYNGTSYSAGSPSGNLTYTINGRALDLRVRVTSAGSPTYPCGLDGYGIFYNLVDVGIVGATRKTQRFAFNSVTDNLSSFTITGFNPDPDLLTIYHLETGQAYKQGAANGFILSGNTAVFPANTFNNGGVSTTVTLIADQNTGGAFDNSDVNARLLAFNHLGSTSGTDDKSSAGRGTVTRNGAGVLTEWAFDTDGLPMILSVP